MSGLISFPAKPLVQPDSIVVNSVIRYANGVGAKALAMDLSYYFEPTSLENKALMNFNFGNGAIRLTDDGSTKDRILPDSSRPATIASLATSADGNLSKDIALEKIADGRTIAEVLKSLDRPQKLVVRARYQDQMGEYQTISQAKDIFNAATYVGTSLKSGGRADATLRAAVVDVEGHIVTDMSDLDLKVIRVETKVMGEELFGGLIKNTIERELKTVRWPAQCGVQNAIANCAVGSLKAGNYAFEVTSKTSKQVSHTLFKVDADGRVYGAGDYYNFGDEEGSKQLPLALNKATYNDGDKAVVSFPTPFKTCRALVTIERADVLESFIDSKACEKGFVEVSVKAASAPNAFVSVYAITGRAPTIAGQAGEKDLGRPTYRLGFANLKVNWDLFKSQVVVKTDKQTYEPGQTVQVEVAVAPQKGKLSEGTVTLIAIEEKILELKKNDTYQILNAMMKLRNHSVTTITALEHVETSVADNSDIPSNDERKGGDEGGDGSSKSEFKRKLFNALVAFEPSVPVVNGIAKFSFKTNDSLTKFKIFAVHIDASQKFGTGEATYL
ncbi:MAG: hypothetical protein EOP06_15350, partial [Proteobacteria bacterium]